MTTLNIVTTPAVKATPAQSYERNLRAALKALDLAAIHNPALISAQFELVKALNLHLKATRNLSAAARANVMAKAVA